MDSIIGITEAKTMTFKGRSFLKLIDYTPEEIGALLDLAVELKANK